MPPRQPTRQPTKREPTKKDKGQTVRAEKARTPLPPHDNQILLQHLRLFADDIEFAEQVVHQRHDTHFAELARRAFRKGIRVVAALDGEVGNGYGPLSGEQLAAELENDVNALIHFQMQHGRTPVIIQMLLDLLGGRGGASPAGSSLSPREAPGTRQGPPAAHSTSMPVDAGADAILNSVDYGSI